MERSKFELGVDDDELLLILPYLLELQQGQAYNSVYRDLIQAGMIQAREVGFDSGVDTFEYFKGMIEGLRQARDLVDDLVKRAEGIAARDKAEEKLKRQPLPRRDQESDTSF